MKNVTIAVSHWSRYPERVDYLSLSLERLRDQISQSWGKYVTQRFVSAETEGVSADTRSQVNRVCSRFGFDVKWREGDADVGDNLNHMVSVVDNPLMMFVQDDVVLHKPFDIEPDLSLMGDGAMAVDMVRYSWFIPEPAAVLQAIQWDGEDYFYLDPTFKWRKQVVWTYYNDLPYLAKTSMFARVGSFRHNGRDIGFGLTEVDYDARCRKAGVVIVARGPEPMNLWRYFSHVGKKSAMTEKWARHWAGSPGPYPVA